MPIKAVVTAVGEVFSRVMADMQNYAVKLGDPASVSGWFTPATSAGSDNVWNGDLLDLENISRAFLRDQHNEEFDKSISDPQNPGTVSDNIVSQLQGDLLASAERAYRSRHRTSVRNKIHSQARLVGHGDENGVIQVGQLSYIQDIISKGNA